MHTFKLFCRYKRAAYGELEKRKERERKLRSLAAEMSLKKALMVGSALSSGSRQPIVLEFSMITCAKQLQNIVCTSCPV